jgi:hypothetical protein
MNGLLRGLTWRNPKLPPERAGRNLETAPTEGQMADSGRQKPSLVSADAGSRFEAPARFGLPPLPAASTNPCACLPGYHLPRDRGGQLATDFAIDGDEAARMLGRLHRVCGTGRPDLDHSPRAHSDQIIGRITTWGVTSPHSSSGMHVKMGKATMPKARTLLRISER